MCLWKNKETPDTANRQTESIGCPQGSSKNCPVLIITWGRINTYQNSFLFVTTQNFRERKRN